MFPLRFVVAVLIAALIFDGPAYSDVPTPIQELQNGLRQQQAALGELQSALGDLRSQNILLKDMLKSILASQDASRRIEMQSKASPDEIKAVANQLKGPAKEAVELLSKIPDSSIPKELKDRISKCAVNSVAAADAELSSPTKDPSKILASCPDAAQLLSDLNNAKAQALAAWQKCRTVLVDAKTIESQTLPQDISGLSGDSAANIRNKLKEITDVAKDANTSVRDCTTGLKDALDKVSDQDKASAALGLTLAFAGQVCLSSGANPWVCVGIFAISALMSLFGDKGGDGGGDGDGKGTGSGVGVGLPGRTADVGPIRGSTPGGGDFGGFNGGDLACNLISSSLSCWKTADPKNVIVLDPKIAVQKDSPFQKELSDVINQRKADRLQFCLSDNKDIFVRGLLLFVGDDYRAIDVTRVDNKIRLSYPPATDITHIQNRNASELCAISVKK